MSQSFYFFKIQFSISTQFSSIWPVERTLVSATTPDQSELRSDDTEGILRIPQNSSITGSSSSDYFESYVGHLLGVVSSLYLEAVGVFYNLSLLGNYREMFVPCIMNFIFFYRRTIATSSERWLYFFCKFYALTRLKHYIKSYLILFGYKSKLQYKNINDLFAYVKYIIKFTATLDIWSFTYSHSGFSSCFY